MFDRHFADTPVPENRRGSHLTGRVRFPLPGSGDAPHATEPRMLEDSRSGSDCVEPVIVRAGAPKPEREVRQWARGDKRLCWVEWPSLAPPWTVPEEFLAPYLSVDEDAPLDPWFDPPTGPFDDESDDLERLQSTYAACVSFFDDQLGRILASVQDLDDVLICVTSSRGLALGEHGYIGAHRAWLHEEIVHVPLLMRLPGRAEAGLRIAALTQPVDLLPTIRAALELPAVETHGFDLLPLIRGAAEQVRPYACSGLAVGDSVEWALRTSEWAFLLPLTTPPDDPPRMPRLFVKPDDRWELNDVRQHYLELSEQLESELRAHVARMGS